MVKLKNVFVCSKCWYQSSRWTGQCFNCKEWNTFIEDVVDEKEQEAVLKKISEINVFRLWDDKIDSFKDNRLKTWIWEFDIVLWWWFVKDSIVLLIWDPWIWKSTLVLQLAGNLSNQWANVLYISWEESISQLSSRAKRIFFWKLPAINLANSNDIDSIISLVERSKPNFVIIDSINIMNLSWISWTSWSVSQIKACVEILMHYFKKAWIPLLIIGQVTKDWEMAGPQVLAHLVDVVLFFEWEKYHQFRMLRSLKNRFWASNEVWVFAMENEWLIEVSNPSQMFLEWRMQNAIWSTVTVTMEWTRPFLVEVQSLTSFTNFSYPKRVTSGIDVNRLNIILAILEKYWNIKFDQLDVFMSAVWWFRLTEPAIDLALCVSLISSRNKKSLDSQSIYFGEVWLSWEIRNVSFIDRRIKEAEKLWFKTIYCPKISKKIKTSSKIVEIKEIWEIIRLI